MVPPAEMVSRPSASQRALASSTVSGSETPHRGPRAKTFSYSTRVVVLPCPRKMCSQPIVHEAQLLRATRRRPVSSSAARRGASANVAAVKLRVGSVWRR